MKILILGGHGFIGAHTCRVLKNQGHTVGVVDCHHQYFTFPDQEYQTVLKQRQDYCMADQFFKGKIEDAEFMSNTFNWFKPEVVIHLATYPNVHMVKRNPFDATNNMINATITILDLCVKHNVDKIVFSSSSMTYGHFQTEAPTEEHPTEPRSLYGTYKLAGERMCITWNKEHNLNYVIMRPSALYGTRDMITRVISQMTNSAITQKKIFVKGADNKLDFSWVEDVADAFARVTTQPIYNEIFNCTRGKGETIMKAARIVQNILGGQIIEAEQDLLTSNRDTLNSCKIKNMTGWSPQVDIEEGIPRYIDWFKRTHNVRNTTYWS